MCDIVNRLYSIAFMLCTCDYLCLPPLPCVTNCDVDDWSNMHSNF